MHYVAYFFGGAFFANFVPHFVSGVLLLRPVSDALRAQLRSELVAAFDAHRLVRSWGATVVASRAQRHSGSRAA